MTALCAAFPRTKTKIRALSPAGPAGGKARVFFMLVFCLFAVHAPEIQLHVRSDIGRELTVCSHGTVVVNA